jgi:uncharacterized protein (TIGR02118 family)
VKRTVKILELMRRKDALTHEEFMQHWEEKHGPLVARVVPGITRYVQNHLISLDGGEEPPFDGVAEVWYDEQTSWQTLMDFYLSDAGKVLRDDEEKFMDYNKSIALAVEEKVIKE